MRYIDLLGAALGLTAFMIVALPKLSSLAILLLIVMVVIGYRRGELRWKTNTINILFASLYAAYVAGSFFTHDWSIASRYLEYKVALALLPLLLSVRTKEQLSLYWPATGLMAGTIAAGIIGLTQGFGCYFWHGMTGWARYCLTSSRISPVHHPTYFAGFLLIGIILALQGNKAKWKGFGRAAVAGYCIFALILYAMCLSLSGILFLVILAGLWCIRFVYRRFGTVTAVILAIASPVILWLVLSYAPVIREDFGESKRELSEYISDPDAYLGRYRNAEVQGNQERLIMWRVTAELIAEHPFGVGTGNVDEYLDARLEARGFHKLVEMDLNPHNQFLQTALEIGIAGMLILVALFIAGIVYAIRCRSVLLFVLVGGLAFNSLFESMFQRQSGIVFYSLWIPLTLICISIQRKNYDQNSDRSRRQAAIH
jgi:O-antigen ligase